MVIQTNERNANMKNLISYSALIIAVCAAGLVAAYIGQTLGNILNWRLPLKTGAFNMPDYDAHKALQDTKTERQLMADRKPQGVPNKPETWSI